MKDRVYYLKVLGSIILSFLLSLVFVNVLFLGGSTKIRPFLGADISERFSELTTSVSKLLTFKLGENKPSGNQPVSRITPDAIKNSLSAISFNQIGRGISQKSNNQFSVIVVTEQEVDWAKYSFVANGKNIIVLTPKGESQPPQGIVK